MDDPMHTTLAAWSDFYLITGTAAATLTGLQFIVQTLLASDTHQAAAGSDPEGGIAAFGSPTVVHFSLALLISALLRVPWPGDGSLRATLGVLGVGALVYSGVVLRRARRQRTYTPVFEDWVWHALLPGAAYATVLLAAVFLNRGMDGALFALAAATLVLLCVGIHNAWDTVTYLTVTGLKAVAREEEARQPSQGHESGARSRRGRRSR